MDPIEAIRTQALLDVMEEDFLYHYRRICRWYSQRFYTPLPQVETMHEDEVLRAFFETRFEEMSKAERKKQALELTETPEEAKARKKLEDEKSDDAFLDKVAKRARKENKKQAAKLKAQAEATAKKLAELSGSEIAGPKKAKSAPLPEVSMKFDDNGNLLDEECIPLPPPRKR
jgi:primosomal protein N'